MKQHLEWIVPAVVAVLSIIAACFGSYANGYSQATLEWAPVAASYREQRDECREDLKLSVTLAGEENQP